MDRNYHDMEKLVIKVSARSCYCSRCTTDDAFSAGRLGYTKACKDFDPERGNQFSTVVWRYVMNEVRHQCRSCNQWRTRNKPIKNVLEVRDERKTSVWDCFMDISDDAQQVIRLIQVAPEEFITMHNQDSLAALRDYLVRLGWPMNRIKTSFKEIKEALR